MSSVVFHGNSGKVFAKKRKRAKGANHVKKAEVKYYNPLVSMVPPGGLEPNKNNFGSIQISNIYFPNKTGESDADTKFSSWYPILLTWPNIGNNYWERIGDRIKLKYLRFKGYFTLYGLCYRTSSWRLVLVRSENAQLVPDSAVLINARCDAYLNALYDNVEPFSSATNVNKAVRHNYYKKIIDVDKKINFKRKVIASGTFPMVQEIRWDNDIQIGATSGARVGMSQSNAPGDGMKYFPFDVTVTCNDWVKVGDVSYHIVLETDSAKGLLISPASTGSIPAVAESDQWASAMYSCNFFCRAYFIDP